MNTKSLRQIFRNVLLIALAIGFCATLLALAMQETTIAKGNIVTWRGGANHDWSNPANWQDGAVPRPYDIVRFPESAPDALIDPAFGGIIGGVIMDVGYQGTLTLGRPLTVRGDLHVSGGTLAGGIVPLTVEGNALVSGGVLTTPNNLMSVTFLEIDAPGAVVMGTRGQLNITGTGTPLTGTGLLDTTTNAPNSVEYTGRATTNLTAAGPVPGFHSLGGAGQQSNYIPDRTRLNEREALPLASTTFTITNSLTLATGENALTSAVIDAANGFAYFGTNTTPGIVVKVRLSDFTRVGALTLSSGEDSLSSAVIDTAHGFAYFGTLTAPGIVVKVNLSDFTRVGALVLSSGEDVLRSAVVDTVHSMAYFGTLTAPGIVVKVDLNGVITPTRVSPLRLKTGEDYLRSAVIDTANGYAYFGLNTFPGIVVKVNLSDFTRVGALPMSSGEDELRSAVIDTAHGMAYFGTHTFPGIVVKVDLNGVITPTHVGSLSLNTGEDYLRSAVIDTGQGFAYFGAVTSPGIVVKVRLSDFKRVSAATLNTGEDYLNSAVIDTGRGFAYFGTSTTPGIVVKINLAERLFLPLIVR